MSAVIKGFRVRFTAGVVGLYPQQGCLQTHKQVDGLQEFAQRQNWLL